MKTIKNTRTGEIRRLKDGDAEEMTKYGWQYTTKSEWKMNRGNKSSEPTTENKEKKLTKRGKR